MDFTEIISVAFYNLSSNKFFIMFPGGSIEKKKTLPMYIYQCKELIMFKVLLTY